MSFQAFFEDPFSDSLSSSGLSSSGLSSSGLFPNSLYSLAGVDEAAGATTGGDAVGSAVGSEEAQILSSPVLRPGEGEPLRHILLGSPGGVRQTIHLLHTLRYVENVLWSPLVTIPENRLIITPRQGEVMSLLIRHVR